MHLLGRAVRLREPAPVAEHLQGAEGYVIFAEPIGNTATVQLFMGARVVLMEQFLEEIDIGPLQFKIQERGPYATEYLIGYRLNDDWQKRWIMATAANLEMGQLIFAIMNNWIDSLVLMASLEQVGNPPMKFVQQVSQCITKADEIVKAFQTDSGTRGI